MNESIKNYENLLSKSISEDEMLIMDISKKLDDAQTKQKISTKDDTSSETSSYSIPSDEDFTDVDDLLLDAHIVDNIDNNIDVLLDAPDDIDNTDVLLSRRTNVHRELLSKTSPDYPNLVPTTILRIENLLAEKQPCKGCPDYPEHTEPPESEIEIKTEKDKKETNKIINLHMLKGNLKNWTNREDTIYIGRKNSNFPETNSDWGNPFVIDINEKDSRIRCVTDYIQHICSNVKMINRIEELRNKELGCFCAPLLCHGIILRILLVKSDVHCELLLKFLNDKTNNTILPNDCTESPRESETKTEKEEESIGCPDDPGYPEHTEPPERNNVNLTDPNPIPDNNNFDNHHINPNSTESSRESETKTEKEEVKKENIPVKFKPSRRSSLMRELHYEIFSPSTPYKDNNTRGFVTDRPEIWVKAFLKYTEENKKIFRQEFVTNQEGNYKEFILHTTYEQHQLIILIKMTTGCVNIKGSNTQRWIDTDFELVSKYVSMNDSIKEKPKAIPINNHVNTPTQKSETDTETIDQLWEENKKLRTAIENLENTIILNKCKCNLNEDSLLRMFDEKIRQIEKSHEEKLLILEKKYDDKVITFTKTIEKEFRTELNNGIHPKIKALDLKIANTNDKIARVDKETNVKLTNLDEEINDGIYYKLENLEKSLSTMNNNIEPPQPLMEKNITLENGTLDKKDTYYEKETHTTDNNTELLILIDSNSKHIDRRKFWTLRNTTWLRCGTTVEATRIMNKTKYNKLKYILIAVGVNDLDEMTGPEVSEKLCNLLKLINQTYPDTKIILNEITPRNDDRDSQVILCNNMLHNVSSKNDHIFIAKQSNIRDDSYSFFDDVKHIKKIKIARYVSNIKIALRQAYGIQPWNNTNNIKDQYKQSNSKLPTYQIYQRRELNQQEPWSQPYNTSNIKDQSNSKLPTYQMNQRRELNQQEPWSQLHDPHKKTIMNNELKWKREFKEKLLSLFE